MVYDTGMVCCKQIKGDVKIRGKGHFEMEISCLEICIFGRCMSFMKSCWYSKICGKGILCLEFEKKKNRNAMDVV